MGACFGGPKKKSTAGMTAEQRELAEAEEERRKTYDRTPELIAFLDKVRLTPEKCQELYMCFRIMDLDGSGSIESDELYAWLQEMSSPFVLNMGAVIGLDKGSPLFFFDFLRMACIFCMFDDKELVKFAYDTFDEYGTNALTIPQLARALHDCARLSLNAALSVHQIMEELDDKCDPLIDFEEFYQFHLQFPKVLWPVFRLQHRLRYQTLGVEFWKNHCHLLFGLRQTRTVNQVALTNAARAEQFEAALEASRDPDTGAIRIPISTRRISSLPRSVLVEAAVDRPRDFTKAYKRVTMYMDEAETANRVSLATQSLYKNASQQRVRALGLKREDPFTVADYLQGVNPL